MLIKRFKRLDYLVQRFAKKVFHYKVRTYDDIEIYSSATNWKIVKRKTIVRIKEKYTDIGSHNKAQIELFESKNILNAPNDLAFVTQMIQ